MIYKSASPRRRSIRLKGYDYSQPGAYFVTVCTQDRACLFGDVVEGAMKLNGAGSLIETIWKDIPARFAEIELDLFVLMPNHIHGILVFPDNGTAVAGMSREGADVEASKRATTRVAPTVGRVVAAFKSSSTVAYIQNVKANSWMALDSRL